MSEKMYKSLISKTPMKFSQMSKDRQYHVKQTSKAKSKALKKVKNHPWTPKKQDHSGELKAYRFK